MASNGPKITTIVIEGQGTQDRAYEAVRKLLTPAYAQVMNQNMERERADLRLTFRDTMAAYLRAMGYEADAAQRLNPEIEDKSKVKPGN